MRSPYAGKGLYPVYEAADGERLDFYYSRQHRCWKMRFQKPGQLMVVKLFDKGRDRFADYCAADRRVANEAAKRNMVMSFLEVRA